MKALPPTAPNHGPCAPAKQSNALFSIITPGFLISGLCSASSLLRKPSYHLLSKSTYLPRTSYNADFSKCIFPLAGHEVVSLFQTHRVLYHYLSYYTFHCLLYMFTEQLYERVEREKGGKKEKEKEANSGNYMCKVEIIFANFGLPSKN